MSAAWLAAEAAFAVPVLHAQSGSTTQPQVQPARVSVRRSRGVGVPGEAAVGKAPGVGIDVERPGPRVFRVGASHGPAPHKPLTRSGLTQLQADAGIEPTGTRTSPSPRRIAKHRQSGPVLQIACPALVHLGPETRSLGQGGLIAELAKLQPVLDEIERAQSFNLVEERFAREWARLSKMASGIRRGLDALER